VRGLTNPILIILESAALAVDARKIAGPAIAVAPSSLMMSRRCQFLGRELVGLMVWVGGYRVQQGTGFRQWNETGCEQCSLNEHLYDKCQNPLICLNRQSQSQESASQKSEDRNASLYNGSLTRRGNHVDQTTLRSSSNLVFAPVR